MRPRLLDVCSTGLFKGWPVGVGRQAAFDPSLCFLPLLEGDVLRVLAHVGSVLGLTWMVADGHADAELKFWLARLAADGRIGREAY